MNKTVRHVFRLCVTARNFKRLPRSTAWTCYSHTAALPYSSNSKDPGLPFIPTSLSPDNDAILHNLSTAKTAEDIFDIIKEYRSIFKCEHTVQAFKMLDGMYRMKNITDPSISKRREFLQLCEILKNDIKSLDLNDAVYVLKVFSYLGVPSTSVISQSLLQLIRTSLSQLSFHRLLDLEFQLKNFASTPLADALKIAIPIMCEIQLNNKMVDLNDLSQLSDVLLFLSIRPGNNKSIEMVINALVNKGYNMTGAQAKKIFKHLCNLEYLPPGYEELLSNIQQIVIRAMPRLAFHDIRLLLGKVVKKVIHHGDKTFYNEEFVDACAKAVISEDLGFEEGIDILKLLYILGHTHLRLIDYLAAKCFENPDVLNKSSQTAVMALVTGLATADYKPIFWESMQEIILKNVAKDEYKYRPILIDFAISMAVFDCYDSELTKKVFSEHFLHLLLSTNKAPMYWNLLLLYQSVKVLCPTYTQPWPPHYILDAAIKANGPSVEKSSLLPILEKAMGGPQYILSNLKSKLGHHIDHIVVMRKGGYPVAANSLTEMPEDQPITYVEDLELPAESQVIIVINMPANAYAINSQRLKGNWGLLLKTLETLTGHTVIPISSTMWNALTDHEKTPYLMQAIRLKCESLSASANV